MKKLFIGILGILLLLPASIGSAASTFKDVPSSAESQIKELVHRGVISGYADNTFRPNEVVTRGQFAAFVSRALGLEKSAINFKDVNPSVALYHEIGRAATAGVVRGFGDGTFKPNTPVTRADMAVMLDRAMQLKGNYTNTIDLKYVDSSRVTNYSLESVKRVTAYGVMGATGATNRFEPQTYGTRLTTVLSIYNMLKVMEESGPVYVDPTKSDLELTESELRQKYGNQTYLYRNKTTHKIDESDLIARYIYARDYFRKSFVEFVNVEKGGMNTRYELDYPNYEIVAFNGRSYRDSTLFDGPVRVILDEWYPRNPSNDGGFLLDLHINSTEQGIYLKEDVSVKGSVNKPYYSNGDFMYEIESLLKEQLNIARSDSKLTIISGGNTLEVTAGSSTALLNGKSVLLKNQAVLKNNKLMVPARETAKLLGLHTQAFQGLDYRYPNSVNRLNIANFPLGEDRKN